MNLISNNYSERIDPMYILGAGMAGLLAGNIYRKHNPTILELQSSLPNNHSAVLRHRDIQISEATSIPFKKVSVSKAINYKGEIFTSTQPKFSNMYSMKVTGKYTNRSISNLDTVARYIAPPDFIEKLSYGCAILYDQKVDEKTIQALKLTGEPIISTLPMPIMWNILKHDQEIPNFEYREISTVVCYIKSPHTEIYQTIYYPNPKIGLYRMSITGNKVMAEFVGDARDHEHPHPRHGVDGLDEYINHFLENDFGITADLTEVSINKTKYGKIVEINENLRKSFIHEISIKHNIFSLGRFATWKNILLDDVYQDAIKIQAMLHRHGLI